MSRNFDLMQQLEVDRRPGSGKGVEPALSGMLATASYPLHEQWARDEALRLVQQIFLLRSQDPPRVVVFAGIEHGNGCTGISAVVAETLARTCRKPVCLVEANLRTPSLPELFGTTNHHGLTDALRQEGPIRSFAKPLAQQEMLWLLSAGALAADSANLLTTERLKTRLAELRAEFEYVILDAAPLTRYADAISMGQMCDGLVLVLEADATRKKAALMAAASLRSSRVRLLGAVLNKRTFPIPDRIYSRL